MSKENSAEEFWSSLGLAESNDSDGTLPENGPVEEGSVCMLSGEESALYRVEVSDIDFAKELFDAEKLQTLLQNNSKSRKYKPSLVNLKLPIAKKITEPA